MLSAHRAQLQLSDGRRGPVRRVFGVAGVFDLTPASSINPGGPAFRRSFGMAFGVIAAVVPGVALFWRMACCISFESHGPLMIR